MKFLLRLLLGFSVLLLLCFKSFLLPLPNGYNAVITRFGKPVEVVKDAGPHFSWPWPIGKAYIFDARCRVYDSKFTQTMTKDKKSIILLTYIVWNIEDPLLFLQAVGDAENAEKKLDSLVSSSKNNILGNYELSNLVSTKPEQLKIKEIEKKVLKDIANNARTNFGIKISELGVKRLAYPENNVKAIFSQMRAERIQYASKYRAEGRMKASIILSETDLEVAKIKADATREAAIIKGKADRIAAEVLAKAHQEGAEFYKFVRSLDAVEGMSSQNAVFLLRSDQPPFNVLIENPVEAKNEK